MADERWKPSPGPPNFPHRVASLQCDKMTEVKDSLSVTFPSTVSFHCFEALDEVEHSGGLANMEDLSQYFPLRHTLSHFQLPPLTPPPPVSRSSTVASTRGQAFSP
ncbi:hypothetical protein LTLLF_184625 [Microtus ochrogaster]|uniref:Uncharacterized protein n=1 Tax=Microtus ochrogaster TaxID=79684 RepID=A0A8J6G690_MICOH|nr:hypothetical protein LTLLF_184625 [Microtus ochrogaster]